MLCQEAKGLGFGRLSRSAPPRGASAHQVLPCPPLGPLRLRAVEARDLGVLFFTLPLGLAGFGRGTGSGPRASPGPEPHRQALSGLSGPAPKSRAFEAAKVRRRRAIARPWTCWWLSSWAWRRWWDGPRALRSPRSAGLGGHSALRARGLHSHRGRVW